MSKNFDQLGNAAALDGTETMAVNQGGFTRKITTAILAAYASASAIAAHLSAYAHGDIAHSNRTALNAVSGTNTGDQDLSGLAPKNGPTFTSGIALPNADNPAANMLDWYLEGDWTPSDGSGASLTLTVTDCKYTRIGNMVFLTGKITYPTTSNTAPAKVAGLPVTPVVTQPSVAFSTTGYSTIAAIEVLTDGTLRFYNFPGSTVAALNSGLSGLTVHINIAYRV